MSLDQPLSRGLALGGLLVHRSNSRRASRATKDLITFLQSTILDQYLYEDFIFERITVIIVVIVTPLFSVLFIHVA